MYLGYKEDNSLDNLNRQNIINMHSKKPVVLSPAKSLSDYSDRNAKSLTVVFKDLGPQVSYRTLFFCEYLGPLLIYPIFYFFLVYKYFGYDEKRVIHPVQTYAMYYWCFHYFKRILETFFIHRFSHATSPLSNVFRNCAYYWTFGTYIAYYVNHPLYTPVSEFCQVSNFYCHIILKNLRNPNGNGGYEIPCGFLFNIVTCANYTMEIYQWLGSNIATNGGWLLVSFGCCWYNVQLGHGKAPPTEEGEFYSFL